MRWCVFGAIYRRREAACVDESPALMQMQSSSRVTLSTLRVTSTHPHSSTRLVNSTRLDADRCGNFRMPPRGQPGRVPNPNPTEERGLDSQNIRFMASSIASSSSSALQSSISTLETECLELRRRVRSALGAVVVGNGPLAGGGANPVLPDVTGRVSRLSRDVRMVEEGVGSM